MAVRPTELITGDGSIAVTEPGMMELLAGARTDTRARDLRRLRRRFHLYAGDAARDFDAATRIYRRCRGNRITPRGLVDGPIVAVAWRTSLSLLAHEIDLRHVAGIIGVEMDAASHRG